MNIALRIQEVSKKFPDKKSVVMASDQSFYTFKEFEERSNQFANRLLKLGVIKGARILLFVTPQLDFSIITFALFKMGAIPILIDPGMGLKNLLRSVEQVKPEVLLSVGKVHWLRRLKPSPFKNIKLNISLNRVGGGVHYLYKNLSSESKDFVPADVCLLDYAAILFTSGGTGIPKGVLYTHGILHAQTTALRDMFNLNETKTDLPGFPLFALFTLAMGMTSVIPEMDPIRPAQCDPKKIVKNILENNVTFAAGSPAIWERVGRYCVDNKISLPHLEQVVMFGAPVRAEIHKLFQNVLPHGDTYTPYGATECLPVTLVSGSEILNQHVTAMNEGFGTCIGKPIKGVEIKIIKTTDIPEDSLFEMPQNQIGEITVKAAQVTPGYFEMEEETKKAKIISNGEQWHRMGDLGWKDSAGNVWFLGRKAHRVESSEKTFYPIQIEAIFNQHPAVRRTALVKLVSGHRVAPGLVIERHDGETHMSKAFYQELLYLKESRPFTKEIKQFFLHQSFPVDVRHNIKIDRIKLSQWAQKYVEESRT